MIRVAVPKESLPGERRVALVPDVVGKLVKEGWEVVVQAGAGVEAGFPDPEYVAAGASIAPDVAKLYGATIVVSVQTLPPATIAGLVPGTLTISLLYPSRHLDVVRALVAAKARAFALELLPRISRSQSMDVLSSQATVAGYAAVILGAGLSPRLLPMLTTAAGTIRPSKVLILGAGVAGLMAIATARRLGAVVEGYDVRRAAGEQVRSLGAKFLELAINAEGQGGYARELTAEEKAQEQQMVAVAVAQADLVITTANVPGRKAPTLVTAETVARMKPGSVLVDLAAESGGNCELTRPDQTVVVNTVTIVGPTNLPSRVAFHASQMYAKNLLSFLALFGPQDGKLPDQYSDEILQATLVTKDGAVVHAPTQALLGGGP
ncbi:MAG TPA: NAD(P) transhydrogenase subunit alpha [Thermoplasmata archaeon]|nr:NAD(P) transhydrogenase subunit alpha [Thermoplasmata archaeon]